MSLKECTEGDWIAIQSPSFSAERAGFEPAKRFWRLHTFQACLFNHSSTSPFHRLHLGQSPKCATKVAIYPHSAKYPFGFTSLWRIFLLPHVYATERSDLSTLLYLIPKLATYNVCEMENLLMDIQAQRTYRELILAFSQ